MLKEKESAKFVIEMEETIHQLVIVDVIEDMLEGAVLYGFLAKHVMGKVILEIISKKKEIKNLLEKIINWKATMHIG